jgi:hypothetical protein
MPEKGQRQGKMLGFVIFFGGMFILLGIALIRGIIIEKRDHPYPYCKYYPRREVYDSSVMFNNSDVIYMRTGFPEENGVMNSPDSIMDVTKL